MGTLLQKPGAPEPPQLASIHMLMGWGILLLLLLMPPGDPEIAPGCLSLDGRQDIKGQDVAALMAEHMQDPLPVHQPPPSSM